MFDSRQRDLDDPSGAGNSHQTDGVLDPKDARPHNSLGHLLRIMNRVSEAEAVFRTAIKLDPKYATPHYNLATLLRQTKRLKEAEVEYRKALEIDPKDAIAHKHLGLLLRRTKRPMEAEAEYRKAIELDPTLAILPLSANSAGVDASRATATADPPRALRVLASR